MGYPDCALSVVNETGIQDVQNRKKDENWEEAGDGRVPMVQKEGNTRICPKVQEGISDPTIGRLCETARQVDGADGYSSQCT